MRPVVYDGVTVERRSKDVGFQALGVEVSFNNGIQTELGLL